MRILTNVLEATGILLLLSNRSALHVQATKITPAPKATSSVSGTSNKSETPQTQTCEFRTINYITDSLPQQCLRSTWSNTNTTVPTSADPSVAGDGLVVESGLAVPGAESLQEGIYNGEGVVVIPVININISITPSGTTPDTLASDLETGELNDASFLSFEEWKKQTLEKAGQDKNANIGNKRAEKKKEDKDFQNNLDSLGDEGEIELDFGTFQGGESTKEETKNSEESEVKREEETDEVPTEKKKTKDQHRNKDAGKTCKERFSYASFDAGATIVKTHPGAKNSKAVLIENKDSYMLSECAAENKFIIIELSEDIWIDTLVLANYEFFSSMIRTFRVSVSDRYPVKIEKWKDVGTYEARNSRDIQAFLIENPQIWARYIRIEFLSHFGSEYYCPLSLVRVHGTRMLESWKETEAADEDPEEEIENGVEEEEEQFVHDAVADVVKEQEKVQAEIARLAQLVSNSAQNAGVEDKHEDVTAETGMTLWKKPGFYLFEIDDPTERNDVCLLAEAPPRSEKVVEVPPTANLTQPATSNPPTVTASAPVSIEVTAPATTVSVMKSEKTPITDTPAVKGSYTSTPSTLNTTSSSFASSATASSIISSANAKPHNTTVAHKNKTATTTSSHPALPTIQESFFKAVSRRLQLLETNSTLSLAYIEEQSKILREAFNRVSLKQVAKTNSFVDGMNATMFTELREIRQQYDQIWQSTIISLESQREESRREILAISTRLNILADEVVFQKRMSIVQSILLILCLGLVIFSRVSAGGNIEFPTMYSRSRGVSVYPLDSPTDLESPNFRRSDSLRNGRWLEVDHRRRRNESPEQAPLTPISISSPERSGVDTNDNNLAGTPPSGADELLNGHSSGNDVHISVSSPETTQLPEPKLQPKTQARASITSSNGTIRTPKKRKAFIRQHGNHNSYENGNQEASPQPSNTSTFSDANTSATSFPSVNDSASPRPSSVDIINSNSRLPSPPIDTELGLGDENENGVLQHELDGSQKPEKQEQDDEGWQAVSPKSAKSTKSKRRFSIARKPLPALPNDS